MGKLLRNITFEIIRLNRIDSLYDPQSILMRYYEGNVKRDWALFLFLNCLKWESGLTVFVVIWPHCGFWSGLYTYLQCWVLWSVSPTLTTVVMLHFYTLHATVLAVITTMACLSCTQSDDWEHPRTCTSACRPRPPVDWCPYRATLLLAHFEWREGCFENPSSAPDLVSTDKEKPRTHRGGICWIRPALRDKCPRVLL